MGAGAFMLPCQLTFFYKLGILIFMTILFSFLFAFGFVMPLLAAAGPSGDQFAVGPVVAAARKKLEEGRARMRSGGPAVAPST